jgi:hypothetical protein
MSRKSYAIFAFALTSFVSMSWAAPTVVDGPIQSPINGEYYSVLSSSDWTDAQSAAQSLGGNLATVRSAAEEN